MSYVQRCLTECLLHANGLKNLLFSWTILIVIRRRPSLWYRVVGGLRVVVGFRVAVGLLFMRYPGSHGGLSAHHAIPG